MRAPRGRVTYVPSGVKPKFSLRFIQCCIIVPWPQVKTSEERLSEVDGAKLTSRRLKAHRRREM
jgi:hypothetical protein